MYLFDLQSKLKRLNDKLYVKGGGLYLKVHKRAAQGIAQQNLHYGGKETKFLEDRYTGQVDIFVEALAKDYMPEYDEFDVENNILVRKGWRSLVWSLVKKELTTKERAQRVFSSSLGEQTYDLIGFDGKLAWAKREAKKQEHKSSIFLG